MTSVTVVGAGIGGLAAAIAAGASGSEPVVFERADDLKRLEVGAGITLWPNGVRVLEQLGVAPHVYAKGSVLDHFEQRTWRGRLLSSWPLDAMGSRLGAPVMGINRPDLHAALAAKGGQYVRTGMEAVGFQEGASDVSVAFTDGSTHAGDVVIGADGIDSAIRAQLLGQTTPRYSGLTMWRAIVAIDPSDMPAVSFLAFWGPAAKFVIFRAGPGLLSWEGVIASAPGERDPVGGIRQAALARFAGWCDPVTKIIEATDEKAIFRTDVFDRRPDKQWGSARSTLLGDAAHPMTFAVGQGAAQALEDAVVLADVLRTIDNPQAALRSYEERRMARTAHFQTMAWRLARIGVLRRTPARAARCTFIKGTSRIARRMQEKDMSAAL